MGKVLCVDLSRDKCTSVGLEKDLAYRFLGGIGFAVKKLYDMVELNTNPYSPENVLIFAAGPFNGTIWPASSRYEVAAKSPATGFIGYSNSGGYFGPWMKYAGFDMIIIKGRSNRPTYLYIENGKAFLKDASDIWGFDTWETTNVLSEAHGDVQVACIGQAGENLVRYAGIVHAKHRLAARSGIGSVMGSKRLKAVVLKGDTPVMVAEPEKLYELAREVSEKIDKYPGTSIKKKYGTSALVNLMNSIGRLPSYNHKTGVYKDAELINGDSMLRYSVGLHGCYSCRTPCKNVLKIKWKNREYIGEAPEYETLCSLGSRVGNSSMKHIIWFGWLCDRYGLDSISAGCSIAFAMELWEKGIIDSKDTGGLKMEWGNLEAIERVIDQIAFRKGFGDLLAEGVMRAAKKIGRGSERYAMHVKGLEIPAQDGRAQKSMGLAHATAARGADHLTHCTFLDEAGYEEALAQRYGEELLPEIADRLNPKYKGYMAKMTEVESAVANSLVICVSAGFIVPPIYYFEELSKAYRYIVGVERQPKDLMKAGERIAILRRAFNIREGASRTDDSLPERFTAEPAREGPCKGEIVELEQMLDEYYKAWGIDVKTGLIPYERMVELDLKDEASELVRMKRLPRNI